MPLGNVLGEFSTKIMSLKQTDIGPGQRRVEIDVAGESTGQASGQNIGSLVAEVTSGRPSPFTVTGTVLTESGAAEYNAYGVGVQVGQKVQLRGAVRFASGDPNLAALNGAVGAVEAEIDFPAMTMNGTVCEWK